MCIRDSYQGGNTLIDFTDPTNIREVGYSDLEDSTGKADSWSTYWYNGRIYQSDLVWGLLIWRLDDPAVATYLRTPYSNPQTAEFTIDR